MVDQALKLEQALALGFNSIKESDEHQVWLDRQAGQNARIRAAVQAADETGSRFIDVRFIDERTPVQEQTAMQRKATSVYPTRAGAFPPATFFSYEAEFAYIRAVQGEYHGTFGICTCPASSFEMHQVDVIGTENRVATAL
jgi:hypothetical protein